MELDRLTPDLLASALDQTGRLILAIRPDESWLPTPCTAFDVRTLVNHTVYDARTFNIMLSGGERQSPDRDLIGDDWPAAYQAASDALMATWRTRDLNAMLKLQISEFPIRWAIGSISQTLPFTAGTSPARPGNP